MLEAINQQLTMIYLGDYDVITSVNSTTLLTTNGLYWLIRLVSRGESKNNNNNNNNDGAVLGVASVLIQYCRIFDTNSQQ